MGWQSCKSPSVGVDRIMPPPRCPQDLGLCSLTWRGGFADVLTVKGLEGGEHPGSLGGSGVITLVLRRGRGGSEGDVTAEQRSKS